MIRVKHFCLMKLMFMREKCTVFTLIPHEHMFGAHALWFCTKSDNLGQCLVSFAWCSPDTWFTVICWAAAMGCSCCCPTLRWIFGTSKSQGHYTGRDWVSSRRTCDLNCLPHHQVCPWHLQRYSVSAVEWISLPKSTSIVAIILQP